MAVAFDAASSGRQAAPSGTTITFSHTCTGSNRAIAVGVSAADTAEPSGVTYNGVALTKITGASQALVADGDNMTMWASVGFEPASGANNVVVTWADGMFDALAGAVSVTGADTTDCVGSHFNKATATSGTAVSCTVTTASDELIFAHIAAIHNGTCTPGTNETERMERADGLGGSTLTAHQYTQLGSDGGAITPTLSGSTEHAIGVISFKAASTGTTIAVPKGTVSCASTALAVLLSVAIPAGSLVLTGQSVGAAFSGPDAGALIFSGQAPTVSIGGTATNIAIPVGSLVWTGRVQGLAFTIAPPAGAVVLTGQAPQISGASSIAIPAGSLVHTGRAPALAFTITPVIGALTFTGQAPAVLSGGQVIIQVPVGGVVLTGQAPALQTPLTVAVPAGQVIIAGQAPTVTSAGAISPPAGAVTLTGRVLTVQLSGALTPGVGAVTWTGQAPALGITYRFAMAVGSLVHTGRAPNISNTAYVVPNSGVFTTQRVDPIRTTEHL